MCRAADLARFAKIRAIRGQLHPAASAVLVLDSLLDACNFFAAVEKRQGLKIACFEEIAYEQGFIDAGQWLALAESYRNDDGEDLKRLA